MSRTFVGTARPHRARDGRDEGATSTTRLGIDRARDGVGNRARTAGETDDDAGDEFKFKMYKNTRVDGDGRDGRATGRDGDDARGVGASREWDVRGERGGRRAGEGGGDATRRRRGRRRDEDDDATGGRDDASARRGARWWNDIDVAASGREGDVESSDVERGRGARRAGGTGDGGGSGGDGDGERGGGGDDGRGARERGG